ncbi:MAG: N-acetylmuramoyl-L-alanine amidase [Lachnospiraceae bacterium]|nr:N-acetylmuramoyl-L-alanine amidase [Lachnospiraceae bacterium]
MGQTARNGRQAFESNLKVIGSGRQSVNYRRQAQNSRSIQHRDVELWDLDREDAAQSGQKTAGRKQEPRRRRAGNPRPVQSIKRRRAKRRRVYMYRTIALFIIVLCLVLIYFMTGAIYRFLHKDTGRGIVEILSDKVTKEKIAPPEITEDYLEINDYSRPGTELKKVKNIFVHYTANAGTTAEQNRSYFANLAQTHERSASAHFIIGYDGTLLQCIPLDEEAYAVKTRNEDSISIECCYLAEDGSFTQETYDTLIHTLAWLIEEYGLSADDILRHYDCGGKLCPLYYAEHEDAWQRLLEDVANYKNPEDV